MSGNHRINWTSFTNNYGVMRAERSICWEWNREFPNEVDLMENRLLLIDVFGIDIVERVLTKHGIEFPQIMVSIFRLVD